MGFCLSAVENYSVYTVETYSCKILFYMGLTKQLFSGKISKNTVLRAQIGFLAKNVIKINDILIRKANNGL